MRDDYIYSNLFWFMLVEGKSLIELKDDIMSNAFSMKQLRGHIMILHQLENWYLKKLIQRDWNVDDKGWKWLKGKWMDFKESNENMKYPRMELNLKFQQMEECI